MISGGLLLFTRPARLNQNLRWDSEVFIQLADHTERQGTIAAQHLIYSGSVANDADEGLLVFALLLQTKLDRFDWVRHVHRETHLFIGLDKSCKDVEPVSVGGALLCAPEALDFTQGSLMIGFGFNRQIGRAHV